jgi:type IX secretion system PorP/SprF family membrane protein
MNKMKHIIQAIGVSCLFLISGVALAQQDPQFTQYFDNALFVNPAYAGSRGMLNVTGIHREQWVGFEGRPSSTTLSVHSPLSYESVGMGLTLVNDQAGPVRQTMIYGDFSYTLRFKNKDRKLSFGIKGGMNMINIGTAELQTTQQGDAKLMQNVRNRINPNFGVGIYYHTPHFFAGVSSPKIIEKSYDGESSTNLERRHFFGIVGGVFDMSSRWKLRPSAQVKMTPGAPISVDLSVASIFRDQFWLGAMYRYNAAFGVFVQYQVSTQFKLGLASDFGTQTIRKYNDGTFELLASYDFKFKKQGIKSPRYF